jgi:hypothetical protein
MPAADQRITTYLQCDSAGRADFRRQAGPIETVPGLMLGPERLKKRLDFEHIEVVLVLRSHDDVETFTDACTP